MKKFNITEETLEKETKKRKNWTTTGIDAVQSFWWKRLKPARRALRRAFERAKDNSNLIPASWSLGIIVLLPKII